MRDLDQRADAIVRVLQGESMPAVARDLDVPLPTVKAWVQRARATAIANASAEKKQEIAGLFLDYIAEGLETLIDQARLLRDRDFITDRKSDVAGVAESHRILGEQIGKYAAAIRPPDET